MVNYYQVLDVPFWASFEDIKQAYRRRLKLMHPDVSKEKTFDITILKEAYDNLINSEKRAAYDDKVRAFFKDTLKIKSSKKVLKPVVKITVNEALNGCTKIINNRQVHIPALSKEINKVPIEVEKSEGVCLEDDRLVIDLKLSKMQAEKGCAMRVPFIDKPVIIRIPAGTKDSEILEVKNHRWSNNSRELALFVRIISA